MDNVRESHQVFRLLLGSVLYQAVWFATVLSAGHAERWWWGALALIGFVSIVLLGWPPLRQRVLWMIGVALVFGLVIDTGMVVANVWHTSPMMLPAPLTPLWLLLLWAAFGIYIALSLEMLYGRYGLAAAVGAIGGTLAYRGGTVFDAILWGEPAWLSTLVMVIVWALVFPVLIWMATKLRQHEQTEAVRTSRMHIALM